MIISMRIEMSVPWRRTLLSLPASVLGNEAALRYGRHRAISVVMVTSAAVALAIGSSAGSSPLLLLALVLV
jgi:hypothetical protein